MKTALVIAAFLALLGLSTSSATAGQATACSVTPNPVSLSTDTQFTVTASGAVPGDYYEVTDQQQGHHKTDEDRVWLGRADTNGAVTATVPVDDGRVVGAGDIYALWPGDVSVKVIHYQQGGSGGNKGASILAACGFTVTG